MKISFSAFLIFTLMSVAAWAAEDSAYSEKARSRQYVGGADESDLKVQTQIQKLQRSKNETNIDDEEGF